MSVLVGYGQCTAGVQYSTVYGRCTTGVRRDSCNTGGQVGHGAVRGPPLDAVVEGLAVSENW